MPKFLFQTIAFEERISKADDQRRRGALRQEACALGDAARDDGRDGRSEGGEEEELHERHALTIEALGGAGNGFGVGEEIDAVGDGVADEKIRDGRNGEIDKDFDEGVDLILVAHRADFEEGEAAVHGEDENGADQQKEDVGAGGQGVHCQWCGLHAVPPKAPKSCLSR